MYSTNYSYYPQKNQNQFALPQMLKGRPVSSMEEVRAIPIDFDGSTFYFPDMANKRIYTKQINMDGTASLNMYELKEIPIEMPKADYITREEFNSVILRLQESLSTPAQSTQEPAAAPTEFIF